MSEQTSREGTRVCSCGNGILDLIGSREVVYGYGESHYTYAGCIACVKCRVCSQPLASYEFETTEEGGVRPNGETAAWRYSYSHSTCAERQRREREEAHRQWKQREEEKKYRIREKLCINCGEGLNLLDKLASRQTHRQCT